MQFLDAVPRLRWLLLLIVAGGFLGGCASAPYQYGHPDISSERAPPLASDEQVVTGRPHRILDASGWIWPSSLLAKLLIWDKDIDSHRISDETVAATVQYLEKNDLDNVLVLVNAYAPGLQWSRLFNNREVGAGWRYTIGIFNVLGYTFMPGRITGGDHYNPYTNTISLFSDEIGVALHEAAHAKDFNRRKYKGLHAALYNLPLAPLYYEAVATRDALSYLQAECQPDELRDTYRLLHPAYGTYLGVAAFSGTPGAYLMAIPGHISGAVGAHRSRDPARYSHCNTSAPSAEDDMQEAGGAVGAKTRRPQSDIPDLHPARAINYEPVHSGIRCATPP